MNLSELKVVLPATDALFDASAFVIPVAQENTTPVTTDALADLKIRRAST